MQVTYGIYGCIGLAGRTYVGDEVEDEGDEAEQACEGDIQQVQHDKGHRAHHQADERLEADVSTAGTHQEIRCSVCVFGLRKSPDASVATRPSPNMDVNLAPDTRRHLLRLSRQQVQEEDGDQKPAQ